MFSLLMKNNVEAEKSQMSFVINSKKWRQWTVWKHPWFLASNETLNFANNDVTDANNSEEITRINDAKISLMT